MEDDECVFDPDSDDDGADNYAPHHADSPKVAAVNGNGGMYIMSALPCFDAFYSDQIVKAKAWMRNVSTKAVTRPKLATSKTTKVITIRAVDSSRSFF